MQDSLVPNVIDIFKTYTALAALFLKVFSKTQLPLF
jgi:hypothetical protein